jgi:hypothetical protein
MNKKKPPHKLSMLNEGPYIVIDSEESKYKIKYLATNVIKEVDDRMLQPDIVANKDYQYSNVEKIIKHKGNPKRKTGMSFLVKWSGFDSSNNTWEKYNTLKSNEELHKYLIIKKLKDLIPSGFKHLYP